MSNITFDHQKEIISINSNYFKNKIENFLYDPSLNINLIEKEKLKNIDKINELKVCIIKDPSISIVGLIEIPVLNENVQFNIINTGTNLKFAGILGKPLVKQLKLI